MYGKKGGAQTPPFFWYKNKEHSSLEKPISALFAVNHIDRLV
jgi:hypothetical protein